MLVMRSEPHRAAAGILLAGCLALGGACARAVHAAPPPLFSRPGGFYQSAFSLTLTVLSVQATIRYTTNGAAPTASSALYTAPLAVSPAAYGAVATIKACAWETGLPPSAVACHIYYAALPAMITSSPLPIVVIDTGGAPIPDEPKTGAYMGIIYNGPGLRNYLTDPFRHYDGAIGIEVRGKTSQTEPQKPYGIETRAADGNEVMVPLLGLPAESDWILYAPYDDKTLMRNVLAYDLSNRMGRYASRTVFCELILNGQYQGVYVLMEKIKWDDNRVNIAKLSADQNAEPEISGGYILKIDKLDSYDSFFDTDEGTQLINVYPKHDTITVTQQTWIRSFMTNFEAAARSPQFADPLIGYAKYIEPDSFVDAYILVQVCKNIDGLRLSAYMHKDRGGKLNMGPAWDFNISLGNANYYSGWLTNGWYTGVIAGDYSSPFWWARLLQDPAFVRRCRLRWNWLRKDALDISNLFARVDAIAAMLDEPRRRHFQKWPILGQYVWPNYYVGSNYLEEVTWMKQWARGRIGWMDGAWNVLAAGFNVQPTLALAHAAVQFTDASLGVPQSWTWIFGDGASSSGTNKRPAHIYDAPGTYTVTLTVSNYSASFGWTDDTTLKVNCIVVVPECASGLLCGLPPLALALRSRRRQTHDGGLASSPTEIRSRK